jgi:hypothetical protein
MKTLKYTSIKCSLNKFCKNDYLKSKINELVLYVNKIIFEGYVLANMHIIWLLETDGVSESVVLGEECKPRQKACKTKRKQREEYDESTVSSASYDDRVGLDPGLHYMFVTKNNMNAEDKKSLAKMSSKEYYHES